jgi:Zn-finger nucleic acid-binding protein
LSGWQPYTVRKLCPECGTKLEPIPGNSFKFRHCPRCEWREPGMKRPK